MKEAVADAVPLARRLVLDLDGLSFCDSSGISALIWTRSHAASHACRLSLCALLPRVARVLQVAGVDAVLTNTVTVDDALAE